MFSSIAPRYDLLNHLLSFNIDHLWWRRTAQTFAHILTRPDACVMDLCCGTGDMAFAFHRQAGNTQPKILGIDFSHPMLQRASAKSKATALRWVEGFPEPDELLKRMRKAGFQNVSWTPYTFGIAGLYRGRKR